MIYKPAMHCTALIVAGGRGRRFGGDGMKQFQLLRDRPLLIWTLDAFERCPCIASIVLVIPQDARAQTEQLLGEFGLTQRVTLCNGGAERVDSVRCGLATLPREAELVAVHDAARPLVSAELIERVVSRAAQCKAAIAALPASDTVKTATDERIDGTLERGSIYLAQTPQAFEVGLLRQAHRTWEEAGRPPVTDDAQLVELLGHPVELVCGDRRNIKVTVADDLNLAAALLAKDDLSSMLPRTGMGYDVHRLVAGRPLILGGVEIAHEKGLEGHSDADVLTHAIGDALLGAVCLGDLGQHFPPDDPRYKDVDSLKLLAQITQMAHSEGYRVASVDSVIACQAPKLASHIRAMRDRLAVMLQVGIDRVSVKATTTEGLGPEGRQEGISAYATVTVVPR